METNKWYKLDIQSFGDERESQVVTVTHVCAVRQKEIVDTVGFGSFLAGERQYKCPDCHGEILLVKRAGVVYSSDDPALKARV